MMRLWETPVPIPNTMVKPQAAEGTWWVTAWENRRLPAFSVSVCAERLLGFFCACFMLLAQNKIKNPRTLYGDG